MPFTNNLLYSDILEETVVIEFVNTDKNIANFIASEEKFGFFKFDRFIKILNVGDIVKVRFDGNGSDGLYKILTLEKSNDDNVRDQFVKSIKA